MRYILLKGGGEVIGVVVSSKGLTLPPPVGTGRIEVSSISGIGPMRGQGRRKGFFRRILVSRGSG